MDKLEGFLKAALAAVLTLGAFLFGEWNGLMWALIGLIVLDYITGVIVACIQHELSSEIGAKGIAKKFFMLAIVAIANIIDVNVIGEGSALKTVSILFYIANECISLIENASAIGVPVPKKLVDILAQLNQKGE
jgi:toxin secretion/phage lysis holin